MGIEPTYSAWKAEVLPLNYTCMVPNKRIELLTNPYHGLALPLRQLGMAESRGLEPPNDFRRMSAF